ncbi:PEPxxWA-CTERM sorting domain-containing protein [Phenylobacterium kunshanense]|nr:PEPxxWA-CTERM sorting domain-containing protein [Phenylobacterium kunshanense]
MLSRTLKIVASAAAALTIAVTSAEAGTLVDGASIFSINGNAPTVGFFAGDTLTPTSGFAAGFPIDGIAHMGGRIFASGRVDGFLGGGVLYAYDLDGNVLESIYGLSFVDWGALAAGNGSLFAGTRKADLGGSTYWIDTYDADLAIQDAFEVPEAVTGVAFTGGGLFVSYGSTLAHYDLSGGLIDAHDYGVVNITGLAYGGGKVFAAFDSGSQHGWASIDPLLFSSGGATVYTDDAVTGLAYGDGGLYVSTEFGLSKYDPSGSQVLSLNTGPVISNGPLAFIPTATTPRDPCEPGTRICGPAGAVPEPSAWALMILGFGAAGTMLRQRRRLVSAAS